MEVFGLVRQSRGFGNIDLITRLDMLVRKESAKFGSWHVLSVTKWTAGTQHNSTRQREVKSRGELHTSIVDLSSPIMTLHDG